MEAERELGVLLPNDYKSAILAIGLPHPTRALLHNIVKSGVELHDLSDLHTPGEIVQNTLGWRKAGLPVNLVVIGSDSMGNSFCFNSKDLRSGSAAIYFWDHDFNEVTRVANSFPEWIRSYSDSWSAGLSYKDF